MQKPATQQGIARSEQRTAALVQERLVGRFRLLEKIGGKNEGKVR